MAHSQFPYRSVAPFKLTNRTPKRSDGGLGALGGCSSVWHPHAPGLSHWWLATNGAPAIPINGRAKTSALLGGCSSVWHPDAPGLSHWWLCASEPPTLRLYQFSAIGPISNPPHQSSTHRILIHVESLFDGVFKAADAMMKRSRLPPTVGVL